MKIRKYFICMHRNKKLLFIWFLVLAACFQVRAETGAQPEQAVEQPEVWMTVFVHGIMSVRPHLTVNNFLHFMTDNVDDTYYSETVKHIRRDSFFYQNQAMMPEGLYLLDPYDLQPGKASNGVANLFEQMHQYAGLRNVKNYYYTFGWHGLMSPKGRYNEAVKMFAALQQEVERFKRQDINIKIRVIGYSHGGSVCLNLGAAHQKVFPTSTLVVDQLVLLGTPIQNDTDFLINDPVFKKIYNIYSSGDFVQRLDFFSFNRFFSSQIFKERKDFILPDKLVQIQFNVVRSVRSQYGNTIEKTKNFNVYGTRSGRSCLLRRICPGHGELWFFGWIQPHYRSKYPLSPLPTFTFVPIIDAHIGTMATNPKDIIVFDVRPDHEIILIQDRETFNVRKIVSLLTADQIKAMREVAFKVAPTASTAEDYENHIQQALKDSWISYEQKYQQNKQKRFAKRCKIKKHQRDSTFYPSRMAAQAQ
jgi:hypothetical protein